MPSPAQAAVSPAAPKRIALPRSSTRLQQNVAYIKIVTRIRTESWGGVAFDGTLYTPGRVVDLESLPRPLIAIECAGPIGAWRRGKRRETLYILWRFDVALQEWREIARAQAEDWRWSVALRDAAHQALHPRPELVDVIKQSRELADEILGLIDNRLRDAAPDVKTSALHAVYEEVAGRIVNCA